MNSGWVLKFSDGKAEIMSEDAYVEYSNTARDEQIKKGYLRIEEHWLSLKAAISKHTGVE